MISGLSVCMSVGLRSSVVRGVFTGSTSAKLPPIGHVNHHFRLARGVPDDKKTIERRNESDGPARCPRLLTHLRDHPMPCTPHDQRTLPRKCGERPKSVAAAPHRGAQASLHVHRVCALRRSLAAVIMRTALVVLPHVAAHGHLRTTARLSARARDSNRGGERSPRGSVDRRAESAGDDAVRSRLAARHTGRRESNAPHDSRAETPQLWHVHSGYLL